VLLRLWHSNRVANLLLLRLLVLLLKPLERKLKAL
jgi:hypothetical protein